MYDIDWEHVRAQQPPASEMQVYKLAVMTPEKLVKSVNDYLYSQGAQKGITEAAAKRYRSGYLRPSEGYPPNAKPLFNEYVAQL